VQFEIVIPKLMKTAVLWNGSCFLV